MIVRLRGVRPRDPRKEKLIRREAIKMVVRDGLDGFAMQRLAAAAKVSPSTLYVYFEHRDDLLFQLFVDEMTELTRQLMDGFASGMSFAQGLRIQWKNRIRYSLANPLQSDFLEVIRNSSYHPRFLARAPTGFSQAMRDFVKRACDRGELVRLPVEVYWAVAFAPLYQLIKFQRNGFGFPHKCAESLPVRFVLTDEIVELALGVVLRGLKPAPETGVSGARSLMPGAESLGSRAQSSEFEAVEAAAKPARRRNKLQNVVLQTLRC
jgi:AcrR family transcriptional regulator